MVTPTIASNAYAALSKLGDTATNMGGAAPGADGTGLNFGNILKDVIDAVSQAAQHSDAQAQAVAHGKSNMIDVVTAVAETETTFQTLVSVRDKVIAAYEDVLKMQI